MLLLLRRTDESSEDSFITFGPKISHVEELEEADG